MWEIINDILSGTGDIMSLIPTIRVLDIIDIIGSGILIYILLSWIRKTRGWALFRGVIFAAILWGIAEIARLSMTSWIFGNVFSIGILAVVIIFQPEIRRMLEKMGTANLVPQSSSVKTQSNLSEEAIDAIVGAAEIMSEDKTGALICIEGQVPLGEHEKTGISLNSDISAQLLINIFEKNTPLHDGAVIIRGNKIAAATCYLPMSDRTDITKELGTRHRAALGLSEVSDAIVVVVSEETGAISVVRDGKMKRNVNTSQLRKALFVSELEAAHREEDDKDDEEEKETKKNPGFFKKYIFGEPILKIVSLLIAAVMWIGFENAQDPLMLQSYTVPVEVRNIEKYNEQERVVEIDGNQEYENLKLTVYIEGRASEIEKLKGKEPEEIMTAYLDLYELSPDDSDKLMIHYEMLDKDADVSFYGIRNKAYYPVNIENYVSKELPVEYHVTGTPAKGYMAPINEYDIQVTPKTITVSGPESLIGTAEKAVVSVDIEGESAPANRVSKYIIVDGEGNKIDDSLEVIKMSTSEVSVYVPIYMVKTIGITAGVKGEPMKGYAYGEDIKVDIDTIDVYGPVSVLGKLTRMTLPETDITYKAGNVSVTYDLQKALDEEFGDGVIRLMEESQKEAKVTLSIEAVEERTFTIDAEQITVLGITEELSYDFPYETYDLTLYGRSEDFEKLDESKIKVTLRVDLDNINDYGLNYFPAEVTGIGKLKAEETDIEMNLWSIWYPKELYEGTSESEEEY